MADGAQKFTEYKDPFNLLNELRNLGMERIYKNSFARGDRSAIEEDTGQLNAPVGRSFSPAYRINADAPSTMFQARQGSGNVLPPPTEINYRRDYGSPPIDRRERQRIGTVMQPLADVTTNFVSDISSIRARRKAEQIEDTRRAYRNTFDPSRQYGLAYENAYNASQQAQQQSRQQAQQERLTAPQISRLEELTGELEDVGAQIEQRKTLMGMTQGIQDFRNTQRQAQGQAEVERRKEVGQRIAESVAPQVTEALPKSGLTPYKMLNPNPYDPENIRTQLENMMAQTPPATQGTVPAPMNVDFGKSNIPPGPSSPFPQINKSQNTATLGGQPKKTAKPSTSPAPPAGYNPSQGTAPGPKSMHRRRPR